MMYNPNSKENLYIAGPECFYNRGYSLWYAQRQLAEYYGFNVVLPTSTVYSLDNEDLRLNAMEIFNDLVEKVKDTTTIIADLEFFRGSEPDSGTVFEIGWVYANGGKCYGYTRDLREMVVKDQKAKLVNNKIVDEYGWSYPYPYLPFCPSLCASTILIEGGFEDCIKALKRDIIQKNIKDYFNVVNKFEDIPQKSDEISNNKNIYLASPYRYSDDKEEYFAKLKSKYKSLGYNVFSPIDGMDQSKNKDPYYSAVQDFKNRMDMINKCDVIVANLNGFYGYETNNDVSFECGYAYGKGKSLIGILDDTRTMKKKIPSLNNSGFDICDNVIENFGYPINLMFACSMDILQGSEADLVETIVAKLEF